MKEKSCKVINENVELQEEGRLKQIDGTNMTYNYVLVNSLVIMNPN